MGRQVLAPDVPGLDGVGYRQVVAMLEGRLPEADLREAIVIATRQYAKRQDTWFRNQLSFVGYLPSTDVWRLDATPPPEELAGMIRERWTTLTADR